MSVDGQGGVDIVRSLVDRQGVNRHGDRLGRLCYLVGDGGSGTVARHLVADQLFNFTKVVGLLGREQGIGDAGQPGASGAADTVDIVFGVVRHVEVDHMADARHVEAARGDVGRDQHGDGAGFKAVQFPDAVGLLHVAVDLPGGKPGLLEHVGKFAHVLLTVAEDDGVLDLGPGKQLAQGHTLRPRSRLDDELRDRRIGRRGPRDLNLLGVGHELVGELLDRPGHRGREQQRLADARQLGADLLDVGDEAHVEHAVGLVDNQQAAGVQHDLAAAEQVHQPARRGDQDIDAFFERAELVAHRDAADQ